jgi:hypothetical protein
MRTLKRSLSHRTCRRCGRVPFYRQHSGPIPTRSPHQMPLAPHHHHSPPRAWQHQTAGNDRDRPAPSKPCRHNHNRPSPSSLSPLITNSPIHFNPSNTITLYRPITSNHRRGRTTRSPRTSHEEKRVGPTLATWHASRQERERIRPEYQTRIARQRKGKGERTCRCGCCSTTERCWCTVSECCTCCSCLSVRLKEGGQGGVYNARGTLVSWEGKLSTTPH